jgi:hypothetical protein
VSYPGVFAAGLDIESAASLTTQTGVRQRLDKASAELDQVLRLLRDTVFGLDHRLRGRGLRQEIAALCSGLDPAPRVQCPADPGTRAGGLSRPGRAQREGRAAARFARLPPVPAVR